MADRNIFILLSLSCYLFSNPCYSERDTLQQGQPFEGWDYLISSNRVFRLEFFSGGTYLGVFYTHDGYQRYPHMTAPLWYESPSAQQAHETNAVWVANRNNPVIDMPSKLMIDVNGKLSILSNEATNLDLFSPIPITRNASATLLDSGNFILQELYPDGSVKRVLWQSFDYPTDTLLPGMKLGINLKNGHRWSLTSWASNQLPAHGSSTLTGDPNGTSQLVFLRQGKVYWMSGPWHNGRYTNLPNMDLDVKFYYISNETEQSFTYLTRSYDSSPVLRMYPDGHLRGSVLGIDVRCTSISDPGCVESEFEQLKCRRDYYIMEAYENDYVYVDEHKYDESYQLNLYDCKRICWSNCSCIAYSFANKNRTGCKIYGKRIYKYNPAEADRDTEYHIFVYGGKKMSNWIWLFIGIGTLVPLLSCYLVYKNSHVTGKVKKILKLLLHQLKRFYNNVRTQFYDYIRRYKNMNTELHYFTFQDISSATNNFSSSNKLGQGGFGVVYKGKLVDGQKVAVKRLSRSSAQGVKEFKNETELIAKLQHTNLVRLLGCCIEKQEKILVYEYMPNNSLDFFLFDPTKKGLLHWKNRFVIIDGIAQGLVYLHKYSRLRVIHRDLKASNILLDDCLNPKISDFGLAKLFGINESEANTSRVVGTRGYMPPEYLIEGTVSTKTDVFGFGVLMLEIVSSKKNHRSHDVDHPLNLVGLTWELWNKGRGLELMDPVLEDSFSHMEVMTCIHVGLLCVQDRATDRPNMSEVISMLTNENMDLPEPKQPAFFIERHEPEAVRDDNSRNGSINGKSISIAVP